MFNIFNRHLLIIVFVLIGPLVQTWADTPPTVTVVANGTGKDEDAALKQAFRNAVQQAWA